MKAVHFFSSHDFSTFDERGMNVIDPICCTCTYGSEGITNCFFSVSIRSMLLQYFDSAQIQPHNLGGEEFAFRQNYTATHTHTVLESKSLFQSQHYCLQQLRKCHF